MKCNLKVHRIICTAIVFLLLPYLVLYNVSNDTISKLYLSYININKTSDNITVSNIIGVTKTSACPGITFQLNMSVTEKWQPVDTNNKAFVFSAYLLNNKELIVIGIRTILLLDSYCQIWTLHEANFSVTMVEVLANTKDLAESHGKRYISTLFKCSVSSDFVPTHVSVVTSNCSTPTNMLMVMSKPVPSSANYQRNFTVCLSPLNFNYSNIHNLIEWIELNRILGAERFSVYNYTSHVNVASVLEFYSKRGLVEVIQWPIDVLLNGNSNINDEIHNFGQVAALHDCLFRNKAFSRFLVNVDLDEFIIPREKNITSWKQMLDKINHDACVYVFRNTFFRKDWNNSNITVSDRANVQKFRLVTLQKLEREKKIYIHRFRSKYIVQTANVSSVMIHEVPCDPKNFVPVETGLVHHYRDWGSNNDAPPNEREFDDTLSVKYGVQLIKRVKETWLEIDENTINNMNV